MPARGGGTVRRIAANDRRYSDAEVVGLERRCAAGMLAAMEGRDAEATTCGKLRALIARPAIEPILLARWAELARWELTEASLLDLAGALGGKRAAFAPRTMRGSARPGGVAVAFADREAAADWVNRLLALDSLCPDPIQFAAAAYATMILLHPLQDMNGRLARALAIAAMARRGVVARPSLALAPIAYRERDGLATAIRALSETGGWSDFFTRFEGLVGAALGYES